MTPERPAAGFDPAKTLENAHRLRHTPASYPTSLESDFLAALRGRRVFTAQPENQPKRAGEGC